MQETTQTNELPVNNNINTQYIECFMKYWRELDWRAVQAVLSFENSNPSHQWIADTVNISLERVAEIMEGLIVLGIVERSTNGYRLLKRDVFLNEFPVYNEIPRDQHVDTYALMSQQIVNEVNTTAYAGSRVAIAASNKELKDELYEKIAMAMNEFVEKSATAKKDGIYAFTYIGTDLTKRGAQ